MEHLRHTAAWFPARAEIAGRRIAPPTLGQWRLLECCASPFAWGGVASREETALALAILSRPWRKARRMLASPWRKALAVAAMLRRVVMPRHAAMLSAWLGECWSGPERYVEEGRSRPSAEAAPPCCPAAVRIAVAAVRDRLCGALADPVASVWDAPVPEMLMLRTAFEENSGAEYESADENLAAENPPVVAGAVSAVPAADDGNDGGDDERDRESGNQ